METQQQELHSLIDEHIYFILQLEAEQLGLGRETQPSPGLNWYELLGNSFTCFFCFVPGLMILYRHPPRYEHEEGGLVVALHVEPLLGSRNLPTAFSGADRIGLSSCIGLSG
jgi:hypothetical protein